MLFFMKLWMKYTAAIVLGFLAAFVLPLSLGKGIDVISFVGDMFVRGGMYVLVPLLFFSVTVGVCELLESKAFVSTLVRVVLITVISTVAFTALGIASVYLFKLPRIPISVDRVTDAVSLEISENILSLIPTSAFKSLSDGVYLLPVLLFACFAGMGCAADRSVSKPAVTVLDSLSRVCFSILSFFMDILTIGFLAFSIVCFISYRSIFSSGLYTQLILLLLGLFLVIAVIIYPLITMLICKEKNPWRILYTCIASVLTAFFSGNTNLTLAVSIKHAYNSLGIKRRCCETTVPLFSIFARGGTALTTAISFIVIVRSYSSLGIVMSDLLWIAGFSILTSFLLGAIPSGGTYMILMILCARYGRGFEAGYLLLKPAMPIICAFAAAIDSLTMMFGSYIVANRQKMCIQKQLKDFA